MVVGKVAGPMEGPATGHSFPGARSLPLLDGRSTVRPVADDLSIDDLIAERRRRQERWANWRQRVAEVRALVANHWATVFPNDVNDINLPMISNLFQTSVEDGGRLFAAQLPQERVDRANNRDDKRAELREQVVIAYGNQSRIWNHREYVGQDLIAAGLTGIRVWPNMRAPMPRRFPTFERLEPEMILPEPRWRPDRPTDHVMIESVETATHLARQFPEEIAALMSDVEKYTRGRKVRYAMDGRLGQGPEADVDEIRIVDYYCRDYVVRGAVWDDPDDPKRSTGRMLLTLDNPTDLCMVQLCARKAWTNEPTGQLDGAKGTERARNRYMRLLTDYFVKMVYGGRLAWNVQNPKDSGPGTVYLALGPDAKMEYVTPEQPGFEVNAVLAGLEDSSRTTMIAPRAREGDVDLNKATSSYLHTAQGQLSTVVASLQNAWADCKQMANEVAMAIDEEWCNTRKEITGTARGRRFAVTYTPKADIRGDYANRVTYGLAAGLDAPTLNVLNLQKVNARLMSRRTAMEMDPSIEDVPAQEQELLLQIMEDAIIEGLSLPTTSLQDRVRFAMAIKSGVSVEELAGLVAPPPAAPAAAPAGGPGAPGLGPPGVPGAEAPLPPMAALQGQPMMALPPGARR